MFYAAVALLATRNLSSARHSGVIALLNNHFVKPGVFPHEMGHYLGQAFDRRAKSDYDDFVFPDPEEVRQLLAHARDFVAKAEELTLNLLSEDRGQP
jgi:uncharacterized protein (UPF0332 family)